MISAIDVIAITENSTNSFTNNVSIHGYKSFFTPTSSSKGGTGLYVKENFDVFERTDLKIQAESHESVWVEIKNKSSKNILCASIYRHPRFDMSDFLIYVETTLKKLSKENKEIYICGDFNIDLLKMDDIDRYLEFHNMLGSYSLTPLDDIFTNNIHEEILSGNIYLTLSEHFSQFASVNRESKVDTKKIDLFKRDFSKFSPTDFYDDVSIQEWNYESSDTNFLMSDFVWRLDGCAQRHAPVKKLTHKEVKLKLKPWISPEISKLIRVRDKLFARKKRQPNNERVKELYNNVRNKVTRELKRSKKDYYSSYFVEHQSNIKKTWEGIRKIVNVKNPIAYSISQLNIDGRIVDEPKDIADNINNFFVNVGPETEKRVSKVPHMSPDKFLTNRNYFNLVIAHISEDEILDIISNLPNKGTGPASLPLNLLKIVADIIVFPLCHIINCSFVTGIFPNILKVAKVLPLHKGGSTEDLNNYRPISLLSIFDKIIEKIMHKRLYAFLESNKVLYDKQFGFRKNNSTTYALMEITERIKESIDSGKYGCGIFIDLKKAFDTVNHKILLMKLEHYGVRGMALKWFESYLTDRKQYVFYNGVSSDVENISCGVPQGSVLGPLLFLLYINDLPNISKKLGFYLFADDTNIYYESTCFGKYS